jgi:hypothetical protein
LPFGHSQELRANITVYSRFAEIGDTILDESYLFLRDGIVYFLYKVLIAEFSKAITTTSNSS